MTDTAQKPKQKPRLKRGKEIKITMFNDEFITAKTKAEKAGYPLARFCRQAILGQEVYDLKARKITAKYLSQIAWIGNNLNQIARQLNTARAETMSEIKEQGELNLALADIAEQLNTLTDLIAQDTAKNDS